MYEIVLTYPGPRRSNDMNDGVFWQSFELSLSRPNADKAVSACWHLCVHAMVQPRLKKDLVLAESRRISSAHSSKLCFAKTHGCMPHGCSLFLPLTSSIGKREMLQGPLDREDRSPLRQPSISSWYCCAAAPAEAALCALHPTPSTNRTFCQADFELKCCNYSILWQPSSCMKALLRLASTSDSWSFSCCTWNWLG